MKKHPYGHVFDDPPVLATPREPGWSHRLDVGSPEMMQELRQVRAEEFFDHAGYEATPAYTHRLVSRRMHNFYNSNGQQIERLMREYSYNPAFMNPEDLASMGLSPGEVVEIRSAAGRVHGIVEADLDVRCGVVSMAHAWGGAPSDDGRIRAIGSNTGRLISIVERLDPRSGQPLMSAIPVNLRKLSEAEQVAFDAPSGAALAVGGAA